jgi:protoheme IX farnesyltransferase
MTAAASATPVASDWRRDVAELCKPGIVKMVVITSLVGFLLALVQREQTSALGLSHWLTGLWCVVGTALAAAGANAINQVMESRRDALMRRTRERPVASGNMSHAAAWMIGAGLSVAGLGVLWAGTHAMAALVCAATTLSYIAVYTPMKPLTPLATWVGAIPGALPPLIGWTAAWAIGHADAGPWAGLNQPGGWSLFLIMFCWQIPHFLAIAWKYREDYALGGYRVLTVTDTRGVWTGWISAIWTVALIAASLTPMVWLPGATSAGYVAVAGLCGAGMLVLAGRLLARPSDATARGLFFGSLVYLPVVLGALVIDAALL